MKKVFPIIAAAIAAVLVLTFAGLLVGGLITTFSTKPTQYENSLWWSEDHRFSLHVYEYDPQTLQCRAELTFKSDDGNKYTYTVADGAYGVIGVYTSTDEIDEWLRIRCRDGGFTVRINRTAELEYSSVYQKGEKVRFNRLFLDPLAPEAEQSTD